MHLKYFQNITTLRDLNDEKRRLIKKYHPDNEGGDIGITQEILTEFEELRVKLNEECRLELKTRKKPLEDIVDKLRDIVGLKIEIIGTWIWVGGNTYPVRETLNELGFTWSRYRKQWYYTEAKRRKWSSKKSMDELGRRYGRETIYTGDNSDYLPCNS